MKKLFLLLYSILIGTPLCLYASEEIFSKGILHQPWEDLQLTKKDKYDENKENTENILNLTYAKETGNRENRGQLILSSPAKEIRPLFQPLTGRKESLTYLGKKMAIPASFEQLELYNKCYLEGLQKSRQKMYQVMEDSGIGTIERFGNQNENISVLLYSTKYNISFFITDDIRQFLIFSQEFLKQTPKKGAEQLLINKFISDLIETLNTSSLELLNTQQYMHFFDLLKINKLGSYASPLNGLMSIYKKNKELFEHISLEIEECEKRYEGHQDQQLLNEECRKVYTRLIEEEVFKDSIREEYQREIEECEKRYEGHHDQQLLNEECRKVYTRLIEEEVFKDSIREEYQREIEECEKRYESHHDQQLLNEEYRKVYTRLIEEKVFKDSIREEYQREIEECEKRYEGHHDQQLLNEEYRKVYTRLIEEEVFKDSIREEYQREIEECEKRYEGHQDQQLLNEECSKVYTRLIEEEVFKNIIKEEYQRDLDAHIDIYDLMLGWGDLSESFLLTCRLGAHNNQRDGEAFYENFIFPFLDSLFMNLKDYYFNFNTFLKDNKGGSTFEEHKRVNIVKFNAEGANKTPGFALRGFQPNPQKVIARKQERGCMLM